MSILMKAIDKFGADNQMLKCIEEMAELTKEMSKYLNLSIKLSEAQLAQVSSNICEEIADVQIVLEQMKLLFPDWKQHEEIKLKRLEELIK